jgi:hypothetical protein
MHYGEHTTNTGESEMNVAQQLASRCKLNELDCAELIWLGQQLAEATTHELSGDDKHGRTSGDKNENARYWEPITEELRRKMESVAGRVPGYWLNFGVGLYPTLQTVAGDDSNGTIHVDYDDSVFAWNVTFQARRERAIGVWGPVTVRVYASNEDNAGAIGFAAVQLSGFETNYTISANVCL